MTITDTRISTTPADEGVSVSTADIEPRSWLPVLNMCLAVAALVISVFALATHRSDSSAPDVPAVPALPTAADPSSNPQLPGCNLGSGACDALSVDP